MKLEIQNQVETQALELEKIVNELVKKYTDDLDEYMHKIRIVLENPNDELTIQDINKILIRLTSYNYFLGTKCELAGIRADVSEAIRAEKYNNAYMNTVGGTVASKQAHAEEIAKEEQVIAMIYSRVYKILKNTCANVDKTIDSLKKILGVRIAEMNLGAKV